MRNFFKKIWISWYLKKLNYLFSPKFKKIIKKKLTRALCGLKLVKNCGPGIRALGGSEVVYK